MKHDGRRNRRNYPCRCDCGIRLDVGVERLKSGNTGSCGCLQRERTGAAARKHGERHSKLYNVWIAMKDRCGNPRNKRFKGYGGRGIRVCDRWAGDFAAFRGWALASGYREGLSIERKDVDGHYDPSNCTWIPLSAQAANRTNRREIAAFGATMSLQEWTRDPRCKPGRITLHSRLKSGWDPELALSTPPQKAGASVAYLRELTPEVAARRGITAFGETKTLKRWSVDPRCKPSFGTLQSRLRLGWDAEIAITSPPQKKKTRANSIK